MLIRKELYAYKEFYRNGVRSYVTLLYVRADVLSFDRITILIGVIGSFAGKFGSPFLTGGNTEIKKPTVRCVNNVCPVASQDGLVRNSVDNTPALWQWCDSALFIKLRTLLGLLYFFIIAKHL